MSGARDTPQKKVDWIESQSGAKFRALLLEARSLDDHPMPHRARNRRLIKIVGTLSPHVAAESVCARGCSHCCYQAVGITGWEARRIQQATGRRMATPDRWLNEQDREDYKGIACTFLKGKECSIYAIRPMACRTHFSLANDPDDCNIKNHPGRIVPFFDFQSITMAVVELVRDSGDMVADVRAYFPDQPQE